MKVSKIIKAGIIGSLLSVSVSSCKKAPYKLVEKNNIPKEIVQKIDSLVKESEKVSEDKTYTFFGNDTLEITGKLVKSTPEYLKSLNKTANKKIPKIKTGMHLENLMIPKSGGGFNIIPVMKPTMEPKYSEAKSVISSSEIYSRNGKDLYVPVKYYGKK